MSSIKNPEDKKLLSLKHDRRNVYGENAKSSRKNIPRSKQLSKQAARSNVAQALAIEITPAANLDLDSVDTLVKDREVVQKRKRFEKRPDAPLVEVLLRKKANYPWAAWETKLSLKSTERLRRGLQDR